MAAYLQFQLSTSMIPAKANTMLFTINLQVHAGIIIFRVAIKCIINSTR